MPSRWLVVCGYTITLVLLFAVSFVAWVALAFPAWVLALSVYVLVAGSKRTRTVGAGAEWK